MANIMMTSICTGIYLVFDFFFHFQKKYIPTPNRIYTPMNIYIGFTLSPKSHAIKRLVAVLNYFLPKKDQPIQMAYITIMAIITPIVIYFISLSMVSLASPESAKCSIILWIISPIVRLYFALMDFRCLEFFVVVRNDRNTCFLLIW